MAKTNVVNFQFEARKIWINKLSKKYDIPLEKMAFWLVSDNTSIPVTYENIEFWCQHHIAFRMSQ